MSVLSRRRLASILIQAVLRSSPKRLQLGGAKSAVFDAPNGAMHSTRERNTVVQVDRV